MDAAAGSGIGRFDVRDCPGCTAIGDSVAFSRTDIGNDRTEIANRSARARRFRDRASNRTCREHARSGQRPSSACNDCSQHGSVRRCRQRCSASIEYAAA